MRITSKSIADGQFFSNNSFTYFWKSFHMVKFQTHSQLLTYSKFLTHRVSLESSHANFQKNFLLPKMAAILNFRIFAQKLQNTKMLIFRKPCYIERFQRNFLSSGYLCRAAIPKSFHLVKFQTHS